MVVSEGLGARARAVVRGWVSAAADIRNEERTLLRFISALQLRPGDKILDVGCGYGSKLRLLRARGFDVVGVEANAALAKANTDAGFRVLTRDEFQQTADMYDVLLMSHVIEHFSPERLLEFMDEYLDRLKPGGHLLIATPLHSRYFHDDFDHVRPYHPAGVTMVFGSRDGQVQYYGRNRITLDDLWFRRSPWRLNFFRGLYLRKYSQLPALLNVAFALLFRLSGGLLGQTDGWVAAFRKEHGLHSSDGLRSGTQR
jgi:SAM-dependent methyltransferase